MDNKTLEAFGNSFAGMASKLEQLQTKNADLETTLAEQEKESKRLNSALNISTFAGREVCQQLAESRAREAILQDFVNHVATSEKLSGSAWQEQAKMIMTSAGVMELGTEIKTTPKSWKLVPIKPTEEMELRGSEATHSIDWSDAPDDAPYKLVLEIYNAMIEAAPSAEDL